MVGSGAKLSSIRCRRSGSGRTSGKVPSGRPSTHRRCTGAPMMVSTASTASPTTWTASERSMNGSDKTRATEALYTTITLLLNGEPSGITEEQLHDREFMAVALGTAVGYIVTLLKLLGEVVHRQPEEVWSTIRMQHELLGGGG